MKDTTTDPTRHTAPVDANTLPRDECSVVQYYALFEDHEDSKAINEALKHAADMLGCTTHIEYQESTSRLTVAGKKTTVDTVKHVWQTALKTYTTTLNEQTPKAPTKSRDDYILGFFEGLTTQHSYTHPRILGLLDGLNQHEKKGRNTNDQPTRI